MMRHRPAVLPSLLVGTALAAAWAGACGKPAPEVERGALLLRISAPPEIAVDELRMWIYDDGGTLFDGRRIPDSGALPPPKAGGELGTVLVQPGAARGDLRVHVRGLAMGARKLDGAARVDLKRVTNGSYDLALFAVIAGDSDGDGVPDDLDDCPAQANPKQGGCPSTTQDGSSDGSSTVDGGADVGSTGGGGGGAGGGGGRAGTGGVVGTGGAAGTGAIPGTGGRVGTGGTVGSGGATGTGGVMGTGGRVGTGGSTTIPDGGAADAMRDGAAAEMPRKSLGTTCGTATECASSFCVDGVCCETACNLECQACAPLVGRCLEVARADDVPQCSGTRTCNSRGNCVND